MSPKEQSDAVKLLARWLDIAKAAQRIPSDDPVKLLGQFKELIKHTDAFLNFDSEPDSE